MIEVKNIKKSFKLTSKQRKKLKTKEKVKIAVDGVSFSAKKGEIFGLLGPNGAGKTTTLRCISTLIKPDEGEISVNGYDTVKDSINARASISFLTNELKFDENFTADYTMEYIGRLFKLDDEFIKRRKKELFEKFEITKFENSKIGELSTGMKQKLSIAISLIHDPDIIIFDEPTNGLDIITARVVTDYLKELRDRGKLVILSTHIMHVAEELCDRFAIMFDGKISMTGSLDEILKATQKEKLHDAFFELYKQKSEAENE